MAATYGQLKDGKRITYADFKQEIQKQCTLFYTQFNEVVCKRLYNKGYSISDTMSYLTMNE